MMMEPRPATSEDTDGIINLVAEVYSEYDCVLYAEEEEPYLLRAGDYFRQTGGEFWVVEDAERIKATVAVRLTDDSSELKTLYVHPSLRRQGWGKRLVELAMEHARRAGRRHMFLWSDTRFLDAHRLYRKMEFAECGIREINDSNNSVEYGFEKQL
jgi:N-acetylglutamate synthase-like GNAT family acetyltransferase